MLYLMIQVTQRLSFILVIWWQTCRFQLHNVLKDAFDDMTDDEAEDSAMNHTEDPSFHPEKYPTSTPFIAGKERWCVVVFFSLHVLSVSIFRCLSVCVRSIVLFITHGVFVSLKVTILLNPILCWFDWSSISLVSFTWYLAHQDLSRYYILGHFRVLSLLISE